jgi:hypothetical protein
MALLAVALGGAAAFIIWPLLLLGAIFGQLFVIFLCVKFAEVCDTAWKAFSLRLRKLFRK